MSNKIKKLAIARRHKFDLTLKAAIMGSTHLEEYLTIDASQTGVSIKALDKPLPFNEGTIIELEIPLDKIIQGKNAIIRFLGKVVRVENDFMDGTHKKTLCGVKLIPMKDGDVAVWDTLFTTLNKAAEEASNDAHSYDSFEIAQRDIA